MAEAPAARPVLCGTGRAEAGGLPHAGGRIEHLRQHAPRTGVCALISRPRGAQSGPVAHECRPPKGRARTWVLQRIESHTSKSKEQYSHWVSACWQTVPGVLHARAPCSSRAAANKAQASRGAARARDGGALGMVLRAGGRASFAGVRYNCLHMWWWWWWWCAARTAQVPWPRAWSRFCAPRFGRGAEREAGAASGVVPNSVHTILCVHSSEDQAERGEARRKRWVLWLQHGHTGCQRATATAEAVEISLWKFTLICGQVLGAGKLPTLDPVERRRDGW